jgi:hypothetical protein
MEKVDVFFLYQIGALLYQVGGISNASPTEDGITTEEAHKRFRVTRAVMEQFVGENRMGFRKPVLEMADKLRGELAAIEDESNQPMRPIRFGSMKLVPLQHQIRAFISSMQSELKSIPLYLVGKRGGFDTDDLIDNGEIFFPAELKTKVPGASFDVKQGTRCIAFDLPTAAGYHFHRANEAVLRKYWDIVTTGAPPPKDRSAGRYLKEMSDKQVGDPLVKASLKDLIQLRRNPLAHPDESLAHVNDAIAVMNAVHTVVVEMLKAIP